MAQQRIKINNTAIVQPEEMSWNFETTSTADSTRAMSGTVYNTPMFTVESFSVSWGRMTRAELSTILQAIVQTPRKPYFTLHYYSPYYNAWRDGQFYVGQGSLKIKNLKESSEYVEGMSCNFIGRNKIS